jgi:hypothetical protein
MLRRLGVIVSSCIWATGAAGAAQSAPTPVATWVPNGEVKAVLPIGNTVYIGGSFTRIGPPTGSGVVVSQSGALIHSARVAGGSVDIAVPDGHGGWYVGGEFDYVDGQPHSSLAHVNPDGTADPNWSPAPGGRVDAIAYDRSNVYVATMDDTLGSADAIAYDRKTGAEKWDVDAERDNPDNGPPQLNTIAVSRGTVYVGGDFTGLDFKDATALGAIDAGTGKAKGGFGAVGIDPCVYGGSHCWGLPSVDAIAVAGRTLYVGGTFDAAGRKPRNTIAALTLPTGRARPFNAHLRLADSVFAIEPTARGVFIGGEFRKAGRARRRNLALLDPRIGRARKWKGRVGGAVGALGTEGRYLYALADGLRRFDMRTGATQRIRLAADGPVGTFAPGSGGFFVGGNFASFGGVARRGLAAIDMTTGKPTSWNAQISTNGADVPAVNALAANATTLFVGGGFDQAGGAARINAAGFDLATGRLKPWDPAPNGGVLALLPVGSEVFAGGSFSRIGSASRNGLAALDPANGQALPWDAILSTGAIVDALAVDGARLYLGGAFQRVGSAARKNLAAVNLATAAPLGFQADADDGVNAILPDGATVYVGGTFKNIGGAARAGLAALYGWGAPEAWDPKLGNATAFLGPSVNALAKGPSGIYAGGEFATVGGIPRQNVAAIDPTTGAASQWNPGAGRFGVDDLVVVGASAYLSGSFRGVAGVPEAYFAAVPAS